MIGRDEKENGICWRWVSTNSWILGLVRDRGRGGNHNNIARITEKERNSLAKTGQSKTSELWEISLGVCWRWVLCIWRRKSRVDGLCPNIWCVCVCVCVTRKTNFGWKEREGHTREKHMTVLKVQAVGSTKKWKSWDTRVWVINETRFFSFGFFAEIEFGDMTRWWVLSYCFWVLRYAQTKHPLWVL